MSDENKQPKSETYNQIDRVIHAPARLFIMTTLYVVEGGDMVFLKKQTNLKRVCRK